MRLVDEQRRLRERGKVRLGYSTLNERGKKVPHKLDKFRFTSPDRMAVEQVAAVYGGKVEQWNEGDRREWQVFTEAAELAVVFITGGVSFSQSREQWQGGHLVRMCDGETSYAPQAKGRMRAEPCSCDLDGEPVCQKTTHLGLILPHVVGLGIWQLVTKGHNAAAELAGSVELIESAFAAGLYRVPARLLIEVREKRRIIEDKAVVRKFAVPVLELDSSVTNLGSLPLPSPSPGAAAVGASAPGGALPVGSPPTGWAPVPDEVKVELPAPAFRDQLDAVHVDPKPRKNAAPKLPPTGLAPRTAAQVADEKVCTRCGEPYGEGPLVKNPEAGSRYVHRDCTGPDEPAAEATAPEPAASQEQATGRGGKSGGDVTAAEPPSAGAGDPPEKLEDSRSAVPVSQTRKRAATGYSRGMTANQHKKVFALLAEALPSWEGATSADLEALRKGAELGIAKWAGAPADITSRNEIPYAIADPLIGALECMRSGLWVWNGEALFHAVDGNRIVFTEVEW
jgi:hypothetical protein